MPLLGESQGGETKLWNLMGIPLKGVLARAAEDIRQAIQQDDRYTGCFPYVIALKMPTDVFSGMFGETAVFTFPVQPQGLDLTRVFRQRVTPTLGGIYTEEAGYGPFDLRISGNFGLEAKYGSDSTHPLDVKFTKGHLPTIDGPFSGPQWTLRMIHHIFDKYAHLKANPRWANQTVMTWHNFKDSNHFVVVPESVSIAREITTRLMYPFSISFKVIGEADEIEQPSIDGSIIGQVGQFLSNVTAGLQMATAILGDAALTASAVLGSVRGMLAGVEVFFTNLSVFAEQTKNMKDAGESLGRSFEDLGLKLLKAQDDLNREVHKIFPPGESLGGSESPLGVAHSALMAATDGVELALMHGGDNTDSASYAQAKANFAASELVNPDIQSSLSSFQTSSLLPEYDGAETIALGATDTLMSLAEKYLGDAGLWKVIVLANNLKNPYITATGLNGTIKPGDKLIVPKKQNPTLGLKTMGAQSGQSPELLWGVNIALTETVDSMPGRPVVDIPIDHSTGRDIAIVGGKENLVQATQMRVWTEQGTMPLFPRYGLPRMLGLNLPWWQSQSIQLAVRAAVLEDSRILRVGQTKTTIDKDVVEIDVTAFPIGVSEGISIPTSLI
jgi:hypothetical protein